MDTKVRGCVPTARFKEMHLTQESLTKCVCIMIVYVGLLPEIVPALKERRAQANFYFGFAPNDGYKTSSGF
jgi:hypothetical protein